MDDEIKFNDLMFSALDHGFDSIKDGDGLLIPFVIYEDKENKRGIQRFISDDLEIGVKAAKEFVNKNLFEIYAIVWDGYIVKDKQKHDAILVEAGRFQIAKKTFLVQLYLKKNDKKKECCERVGKPVLVS